LTTREQSPDEIPVLVVIMTWYLRHNFSSSTLWSIYDKTMSTIVMLDHVRLCNSLFLHVLAVGSLPCVVPLCWDDTSKQNTVEVLGMQS
jgi:hypothetical protein